LSQEKAKKFAARHGFKLRKVPHSVANPNGYIKVIFPDKELQAVDWGQALSMMQYKVFK
jgi:hypothetical protein